MVDEGDDEKLKGLKSGQKLFSKCVFGLIRIWVLLAYISRKNTLIFGNSKELQQYIEIMGSLIQRRIMVLCKTF
jgi:predicted transcriptional regulator